MKITQIDQENKGAFKAIENDVEVGKMEYSKAGDKIIIIDHTEINPKFKGQGIGNKILMSVVAYAREHKLKIMPLCPFSKSVFDKTEEIRDVLHS